jgi:outer membrane translocation and assembly module TamA
MRGFGERALSPFVRGIVNGEVVDVPYGGGAILELSVEGRFRIGTVRGLALGGVVFLDGGDTTERLGELDVLHLHWAPGAGLRVRTVIGALRVDAAYRIDRIEAGEPAAGSRFAVHVSIGEAF